MHALSVLARALWRSPHCLYGQSILPAHVAWENVHLGAILGDGAARDGNAALAQDLDDLVNNQRRAADLMFDKVENRLIDLTLLSDSPVAVWMPPEKKYFISKTPWGVA